MQENNKIKLHFGDGKSVTVDRIAEMPPTATAAHLIAGDRWKFVSPSRSFDDGLAIWPGRDIRAVLHEQLQPPYCLEDPGDVAANYLASTPPSAAPALPSVGDIRAAMWLAEFANSLAVASGKAGGKPLRYEDCKDMTLAELAPILAPNCVLFVHSPPANPGSYEDTAQRTAHQLRSALPFLGLVAPPATPEPENHAFPPLVGESALEGTGTFVMVGRSEAVVTVGLEVASGKPLMRQSARATFRCEVGASGQLRNPIVESFGYLNPLPHVDPDQVPANLEPFLKKWAAENLNPKENKHV